MKHLVQFSTGVASALMALEVYAQHGDDTVLITADTLVEDEDNWRFAREVVALMPGVTWTVLCDGRTPMQVGRDERCVPNNRMAVCSKILKRETIRRHIDATYDPADTIIYIGYDYDEKRRVLKAIEPWQPYRVAFPLVAKHRFKWEMLEEMRALGIEPPRLYLTGAPHANCGGACVRGGQAEWARLLFSNPERYREWEAEEETTRQYLGKDVAILRDRSDDTTTPLTLRAFRERLTVTPSLFDADDTGPCGCDPWS